MTDDAATYRPDVTTDLDDLLIVSNREPYVHEYAGDGIEVSRGSGGLVTALDAAASEVGGTWIAWGGGSADFDPAVVDGNDETRLPPGEDAYTLRRVDLSREQLRNYYYGYSNQVLWPLCHLDTNYVDLDPDYWSGYRDVNRRFAEEIVAHGSTTVWLHDYHLTLAPRFVRDRADRDHRLVHFWHIPWPAPDALAITPHAEAILDGLLANDAVGFQTEAYRTNFLDCVAALVDGATVDRDRGAVAYDGSDGERSGSGDGRTDTYVDPVGVPADDIAERAAGEAAADAWETFRQRHGVPEDRTVAVGVDRLDYTKGLLERLDAVEHLLETRPRFREELTYVQKGSTTRERIDAYRRYHSRVRDRVHGINDAYGTDEWTPVVFTDEDWGKDALLGLYRAADLCVVTPRRDGMNLVAKEYVAASRGADGALVLSEFAGAAGSLCPDAVPVNPYDVAGFADRLERALELAPRERADRLDAMYRVVEAGSIDGWLRAHLDRLAG